MNTPEIRNNEILAPETIEVRDKIIDKFGDKPLIEMNEFVKNFLRSETDPLNRLGAMAARVYILRHRISIVASEKFDDKEAFISEVKVEETNQKSKIMERTDTEFAEDLGEWVRLRIVESSEVNGVRFPEGVIIDVKNSDALKLLESKKAVIEETPDEEVKAEETPAEEAVDELSALMQEIEEKNSSSDQKK